jgi:hypothetical protein
MGITSQLERRACIQFKADFGVWVAGPIGVDDSNRIDQPRMRAKCRQSLSFEQLGWRPYFSVEQKP